MSSFPFISHRMFVAAIGQSASRRSRAGRAGTQAVPKARAEEIPLELAQNTEPGRRTRPLRQTLVPSSA